MSKLRSLRNLRRRIDFLDPAINVTVNSNNKKPPSAPPGRMAQLQALLELNGFKSLEALGKLELKSSSPIFVPKGCLILPDTKPISNDKVQVNFLKQSKLQKINAKVLKSRAPIPAAHSRTSRLQLPINVSYLLADTLVIEPNTDIVLDGQLEEFIILANTIIFQGSNSQITWSQPQFSAVRKQNRASKRSQSGEATGIGPVHGLNGKPGQKGNPGKHKAESAPLLEIYTLNVNGTLPKINLKGQDGQKGGKGQDGQHGQDGKKGCPTLKKNLFCNRQPGQGGNGGRGGNGGSGGNGGAGGNGGKFTLYTTSQNILNINQSGISVDLSGGKPGEGGEGGRPGDGGRGGARGDMDHPRVCSRGNRTSGSTGSKGNTGPDGPDGMEGAALNNNLKFVPITASDFNTAINQPAIISVNPSNNSGGRVHIGDTVDLIGRNFSSGDTVLLEDYDGKIVVSCPTTFVGNNSLSFQVPTTIGGKVLVQVKQSDGTLSINRGTLVISPKVDQILPDSRIVPGRDAIIKGSGFDRNGRITLNGNVSSTFEWIDYNTIKFKVKRPSSILRNKDGENALLQVVNNEGFGLQSLNKSNEVPVVLDTYHIVFAGDSTRWNGGIPDPQKDSSLLRDYLENKLERGVYLTMKAHHGAKIGRGDTKQFSELHGELSTRYPTIAQQVESMATNSMANKVDLFIVSGGANDIPITEVMLNGSLNLPKEKSKFKIAIDKYVKDDFAWLLEKIAVEFPEARILANGYYHIYSDKSDPNAFNKVATTIAANILAAIEEQDFLPMFLGLQSLPASMVVNRQRMIMLNDTWVTESTRAMKEAVRFANAKLNGDDRIHFVDSETQPENAAYAPQSLVWYPNPNATPRDPLLHQRKQLAQNYVNNSTKSERKARGFSKLMTEMNSNFHPNLAGAQRYFQKMKEVVDQFPEIENIALKSKTKGYVALDISNEKLMANGNSIDAPAVLECHELSNGKMAFKAKNGKYVCAEYGGGSDVNVNRDLARGWENLEIIDHGNSYVAIKTLNGQYLSVANNGLVRASATTVTDAELFELY